MDEQLDGLTPKLSFGTHYGLVTSVAGCVMRWEPAGELCVNLLCEIGSVPSPFLIERPDLPG